MELALFILNILNFSKNEPIPCFQKHWSNQETKPEIQVRWKDPITGQWKGSDPLLTMGRGFGCIFPIGDPSPIWVPARNLKFTQERGQISKSDRLKRHSHIEPKNKKFLRRSFLPFQIIDVATLVDTAARDCRITYPLLADLRHCHGCATVSRIFEAWV